MYTLLQTFKYLIMQIAWKLHIYMVGYIIDLEVRTYNQQERNVIYCMGLNDFNPTAIIIDNSLI